MNQGPSSRENDDREIEAFAEQFDAAFRTAAGKHAEARALDPDLWQRIQARDDEPIASSYSHTANVSTPIDPEIPEGPTFAPRPITSSRFRWIAAAIVTLVLAGTLAQSIGNGPADPPTHGASVQAPVLQSPVASEVADCSIEPLTVEAVLAKVLSVPPSGGQPFPHTETWLPAANGEVETATGPQIARVPNESEYLDIQRVVDRYLICQETGTNFQLWALESEYEIQRQVTEHLLQRYGDAFGPEIDEAMLIEEIERLGPLMRREVQIENQGGTYLTLISQDPAHILRINQVRDASLVSSDDPANSATYAWAGLELRSAADESVISRHSAWLDGHDSDSPVDETLPLVGVLILRFDLTESAWKVEWFIPSV